ncbi:MAG TPA: hypothetical protein VIZ69_09575 [Thermoanaerobaculia bacterium]
MKDGNAHPSLRCECGAILYGCVPDRPGETANVRCARCGRGIRFQRTLAGWATKALPWKRKREMEGSAAAVPARRPRASKSTRGQS